MRIAIVGAGPAGCHLAYRLTSTHHEILLFDPRAPWEKPCGGGIRAASRPTPSHSGMFRSNASGVEGSHISQHLPDVMALPFPRHSPTRLLLRASDGSQVEQIFEQAPWAIVSRADLGQALLERALQSRPTQSSRPLVQSSPGEISPARSATTVGLHPEDEPTSGTAAAKAPSPLRVCAPAANGPLRFLHQKVVNLERSGADWRVRTASGQEFSADYLIGTDGVRSIVRRRVVGPIPRQHLGLAVGYWVRGAPDALVFQTFSDLEGYLWSFPRAGHASVGIGSRLGALPTRELWRRLDRFLDDVCPGASKACPARPEHSRAVLADPSKVIPLGDLPGAVRDDLGATSRGGECVPEPEGPGRREGRWAALLPMAGDPTLWNTPCAGPRWALLGDAAGHVHPITGEGIAYALWSAELLAQAFEQGNPLEYETMWREQYGSELAAASTMLHRTNSLLAAGGYEILFQLMMAQAMKSLDNSCSVSEIQCHPFEKGGKK